MAASSSSPLSLSAVTHYWKQFNLYKLQRELDETAAELAARQDESETSRKKLVEQSKEFKKNTPEDVKKQVTPLLKGFQGEVDRLSGRSKAAEAAFLSLYKKIVETPDPVAALENAGTWQKKSQRAHDLELECANLRETLEQYNAEFAEIKNQEVTIRQLREKIKSYEDTINSAVEEKVEEKEANLQRFYQERETQMQEAGNILSAKHQEAERRAEALQTSLKAAQKELYGLRSRSDDSRDARATEVDMIVSDSERASQRAEAAERELVLVKEELERVREEKGGREKEEDSPDIASSNLTVMEAELSAKDKQISQLLCEIQNSKSKSTSEKDALELKEKELIQKLEVSTSQLRTLESRLQSQTDYEDIKKELGVMKSIEFGSEESSESKSLEVMLLEKNKALQAENTFLKVNQLELQGERVTGGGGREEESGSVSGNSASRCSANQTPPGPLQQVVDVMGCFIGAELVNAYNRQLQNGLRAVTSNPEPEKESTAEPSSTSPTLIRRTRRGASTGVSPLERSEVDYELETLLKKHKLFDIEGAIRKGMSKSVAEAKALGLLQDMVTENVGKLGDVALDTTQVASHCRHLLTMYNLGQRLFAKTILNQSQGSLSELLSKPRPWERLTEKGREAFRKMYAWVSDEKAIVLLRSLSPRRPYMSTTGARGENENGKAVDLFSFTLPTEGEGGGRESRRRGRSGTEEETPALPSKHSPLASLPSPQSKTSANNRWRHDDIPKEMVFEIYQRELAKLKKQESSLQQELKGRVSRNANPLPPLKPAGEKLSEKHSSGNLPRLGFDTPTQVSRESSFSSIAEPARTPEVSSTHTSSSLDSATTKTMSSVKRVLPAVTQEQFEFHSDINTEELVKTVKEFLSNQSISQRLFGEHVLGLSQGSVSDLLARPKPWHMLTQKGREPFIRMKIFLSDERAVESLRNRKSFSSYTNSASQAQDSSQLGSQPNGNFVVTPNLADFNFDRTTSSVGRSSRSKRPPTIDSVLLDEHLELTTGDIDTQSIVEQVKEILHSNSIGQKVFGEAVLGVSQGTVSELLSKPKPWSLLSLRGREPYIRMQWWLKDPKKVEKLEAYLSQRRHSGPTTKRPYDEMNREWGVGGADLFSNYPPCHKKARSLITDEQKEALRFAFDHDPYPSTKTLEFLSQELNLSLRTVVNWFHNHRMRVKLQVAGTTSTNASPTPPDTAPTMVHSSTNADADAVSGGNPLTSRPSNSSWRKGLMDVISMLSHGSEDVDGCGESNTSGSVTGDEGTCREVKQEAPSPTPPTPTPAPTPAPAPTSPNTHLPTSTERKRKTPRKVIMDKMESRLNQEDLDWNVGLREETMSALEKNLNTTHTHTQEWEF